MGDYQGIESVHGSIILKEAFRFNDDPSARYKTGVGAKVLSKET